MLTFEQYYTERFEHWVNYLSKLIGNREEAEDRVQDVFTYLSTRKAFCEELIEADEFGAYVHGAVVRQIAQMCREQNRRVSTVTLDMENMDFISWIADGQQGNEIAEKVELDDFYERASAELLVNTRAPLKCTAFETVGELQQYIFIQYARNNRTFDEIGGFVGLSHQNVHYHYNEAKRILIPLIEGFIHKKLNAPEN